MTAVELVVNLRREVDDVVVEDIVSELRSPGSHALVVDLIVRSSLGDIDAQRELHSRELLDVSDLTAILATAVERNGISGGELNKLLEMSEKACHELSSAGDVPALHPAKRGVLTGPWDAGEREARDGEIDFGGLRIPVSAGYELAPGWAGDGLEAVTSHGRRHHFSFRPFMTPPGRPTGSSGRRTSERAAGASPNSWGLQAWNCVAGPSVQGRTAKR
ncbi:hypothetical protein M6G08_09775 [Streptomyces sp. M92]|nr:hypothetical protein [Streptomyces sp. M92]WCN02342.1 hypothetical protein M6G08_09775 [Streptomyces sp. M92]